MKSIIAALFSGLLLLIHPPWVQGQQARDVLINLALLDGVEINRDNLLNFQILSNLQRSENVKLQGSIRFRNKPEMFIRYETSYKLVPGINFPATTLQHITLQYSSQALKELFEIYKKLPEGIYEYCVTIETDHQVSETEVLVFSDCLYQRSQDVFLINLIDPEDDAKIYEYNPMLSWMVTYPFAGDLSYRIRVSKIKEGQNNTAAVNRNNPVFEQKDLRQTSVLYPVFAQPLEKDQPYAWTVDAYYKGILLGGAEPWRFTIIEDSLFVAADLNQSYVDIEKESGRVVLLAPGRLKIKYILEDLKYDSLQFDIITQEGRQVKFKQPTLAATYGENQFILELDGRGPFRHMQVYTLNISTTAGKHYRLLFKYINPELIK